jgi:hypothetical protein
MNSLNFHEYLELIIRMKLFRIISLKKSDLINYRCLFWRTEESVSKGEVRRSSET